MSVRFVPRGLDAAVDDSELPFALALLLLLLLALQTKASRSMIRFSFQLRFGD